MTLLDATGAPPWMLDPETRFGKTTFVTRLAGDCNIEKIDQGVRARMPGLGTPTAIPLLCDDRVLEQGPSETDEQIEGRLSLAFDTWDFAGTRHAVLEQVYWSLYDPAVTYPGEVPILAIVGSGASSSTWSTLYSSSDPTEAVYAKTARSWNWDGAQFGRRAWLILYASSVATGLSGSAAQYASAAAGSLYVTGPQGQHRYGQLSAGVWVPNTTGTPVNHPWVTVTGVSGLTSENVGDWLLVGGSSAPFNNNGFFPIVQVLSGSSCVVANPNAMAPDTGPLTWSIETYPGIAPGPVWGAPGYVFGQGQSPMPPIDTGSNVGGVWRPTTAASSSTTNSWGLVMSPNVPVTLRRIAKTWKSATTWYPDFIVAFDGGAGLSGSAFSPYSSSGSGNPDGTFGGRSKLVAGVRVPNRLVGSHFDAYIQGTGSWSQCGVPNVT